MDEGRKHDVKLVEQGLKSPDPLMREVAKNTESKIKRQLNDKWTKSARERLIEETLAGREDNAHQIRDDMVRHRGGRLGKYNRGEVLTTAFSWPEGEYERVFGHK
jgi:hypothetical protein